MKFAVTSEQRDYFRKNGLVPFSDLLSQAELAHLNQGIDAALSELKKKGKGDHQEGFVLGHDLWRTNENVKKIVFSRRLVELAFDLLQKKPLRLAFDQLLPEATKYMHQGYFPPDASFQDLSCISNLQGLFLICIKSSSDEENPPILEEGSGYFILPSTTFPFTSLTPSESCRFFLIAYCDTYSQYLKEERDPHTHFLKNKGYVFGDKLNDSLHPILLR